MKIFYFDAHKGHAGALEMRGEGFVPMAECPERMDVILAALSDAGLRDVQAPEVHNEQPQARARRVEVEHARAADMAAALAVPAQRPRRGAALVAPLEGRSACGIAKVCSGLAALCGN